MLSSRPGVLAELEHTVTATAEDLVNIHQLLDKFWSSVDDALPPSADQRWRLCPGSGRSNLQCCRYGHAIA